MRAPSPLVYDLGYLCNLNLLGSFPNLTYCGSGLLITYDTA
jgi:hypothetical protein